MDRLVRCIPLAAGFLACAAGQKCKQLPAARIDVLRRWIDQGAHWAD